MIQLSMVLSTSSFLPAPAASQRGENLGHGRGVGKQHRIAATF